MNPVDPPLVPAAAAAPKLNNGAFGAEAAPPPKLNPPLGTGGLRPGWADSKRPVDGAPKIFETGCASVFGALKLTGGTETGVGVVLFDTGALKRKPEKAS